MSIAASAAASVVWLTDWPAVMMTVGSASALRATRLTGALLISGAPCSAAASGAAAPSVASLERLRTTTGAGLSLADTSASTAEATAARREPFFTTVTLAAASVSTK